MPTILTPQMLAAADARDQAPARNPTDPIGTPPGGGSWCWSAEQQAWLPNLQDAVTPTPTK